jgi:type III pantothenate kinase
MITLVLDFGNTNQKAAIYTHTELQSILILPELTPKHLEGFIEQQGAARPTSCIMASVVPVPRRLINFLTTNFNFFQLDVGLPLPISINYATPTTLGADRIAAATAASLRSPNHAALSIIAGSCIIYDFVDQKGGYQGGAISPGLEMRLKALNTFSKKLPLVPMQPFDALTGATTHQSILSGVINGIAFEIDGFIEHFKLKNPDINVFVSGGNLNYFDKRLKNNIFAVPNLVLEGLNKILLFNENQLSV